MKELRTLEHEVPAVGVAKHWIIHEQIHLLIKSEKEKIVKESAA